MRMAYFAAVVVVVESSGRHTMSPEPGTGAWFVETSVSETNALGSGKPATAQIHLPVDLERGPYARPENPGA